jgi:O-antigen ligase
MDSAAATAAGALLLVVFFTIAMVAPRAAVFMLTVLGAFRLFQAFSFAGSRIAQGFYPAELMASVCVVFALFYALSRGATSVAPQIDRPFVALLGIGAVSIVVNWFSLDPAIDQAHVKTMVSIGQLALFAWPWAIYQFVARYVDSERMARALLFVIIALGSPIIFVPFVSDRVGSLLGWSVYFGLAATPFCFAQLFFVRSIGIRVLLTAVAITPAIIGFIIGKTFLYAFAAVTLTTVAALRRPRLVVAGAVVAAGLYFAVFIPLSHSVLPDSVQELVKTEESQGSWGGKSGRAQLAADALWIWQQHPVFGVGPGNSWPYMHKYSAIDTPHSQYLNILLETGITGLLALLFILFGCFRIGWRLYWRAPTPFMEMFTLGWLGYFAGMSLGGFTGDFILHSVRNSGLDLFTGFYLQWVMLGVLVALNRLSDAHDDTVVAEEQAA